MESQEKNNKRSGFRFLWRALALLLALVLVAELAIPQFTRVSFSEDKYEGMSRHAAELIKEYEQYLRESRLKQGAIYMRSKISPSRYQEYASKAAVAIGQEKYAEAAEYLGVCLESYEGDSEEELASLHLKRAGLYILGGDTDRALPELDSCLALKPEQADALYLRVQLEMEKERYADAARDALAYEKLEDTDPESLEVFARLYEVAELPGEAVRCYTELLQSDDRKIEFYKERGRLRLLTEDVAGAAADFEQYFLENGSDEGGSAALMLCGCYLQQEKYEAAEAAYDSALEHGAEPGADLKAWMAAVCLTREEYERGETLLSEILEKEPDYERANYLMGLCLYGQEKHEEAAAAFSRSLELEEETVSSSYYRGLCYLQLEKIEEAAADLELVAKEGEGDLADSAAEILKLLKD